MTDPVDRPKDIITERVADASSAAKATAMGYLAGFYCLFRGLKFVYVENRSLLKFCIPPMVLAVGFIVLGWWFFAARVDDIIGFVWAEPEKEAWYGILHYIWSALSLVLWLILAVASAVVTVMMFSLLAAPFSDFISERAEGYLGTWTPRPFSIKFVMVDLFQTVALELTRIGIKLAWLVPLFILSLVIPVLGQAIYIGFGGYLLSKFTGMDYVDWCAARRGWTWKSRFAFAKTHRFALAGFGSAVLLSLMVPLAFVVVWPAAVAGGAILFTSLQNDLQNDSPPTGKPLEKKLPKPLHQK